jgi:hypothetical protein
MDIIMNGITGEEGRDMTVSYHAHEIEKAN